MSTWIKETDDAIYLMSGNGYLQAVPKRPSQTNAQEQVANVSSLKAWFARSDRPRGMTVSVGTGAPEPEPVQPPPDPGDQGLVIEPNGQLKVVSDTFFKISPQQSSQLGAGEKVLVRRGTIVQIRYYNDVGNYHWLIELVEPTIGDGTRNRWYVYTPDIRLGTASVLTVTYDTLFKLEPKPSTQLPSTAKVFVQQGREFQLASFMSAVANHTQIELADTTLGPSNGTVWYVYNLHAKATLDGSGGGGAPHDGLQVETISDTYFTLSPKPPEELPDAQKVQVQQGNTFDIQYYTDLGDSLWLIELVEPTLGDGKTTTWYVNPQTTKLVSAIALTTLGNTVFKRAPRPSSELPEADKIAVPKATEFKLVGYLPAPGNHTQIELADTALGPGQATTWYVYNPHVTIAGRRELLRVVSDTVFKTSVALSSELPADEKVLVKKNTIFELASYTQPKSNHIKVALKGAFLGPQNRNTWYAYLLDIYVVGTNIGNNPDDNSGGQPPNPGDRGIALQFPGFSGTYYANDPIYWETQYGEKGHFTWGEALHVNNATGSYRRPANANVIYGILRIATAMEDIRKRYGVPIKVNSWYRDPATNNAVGGASQSRHLLGDALDFVVPGRHPFDVYADLDSWWGNRGGLASANSFTHIDARGYRARWSY
ncbi:D-Ala-D-Ala carboxypeptidase family metallohydrolase [Nodosilinea sp. LEGE 07088]|uniref:D-Ala-D-Ala carboxypeptidase family metallohydrolase n=1 Tax=Nodosilinea sp. LEGE 07088 TaxID=2777968 RepID=UPI001D14B88A|nr:D-Ala-D-Ala carboxypeptidase family metallohydrolase [Nodosilinea sp. LEGE 07088]